MNKVVYNGGFALGGILLLVGMAYLQQKSQPVVDPAPLDVNVPINDANPNETAEINNKEELPVVEQTPPVEVPKEEAPTASPVVETLPKVQAIKQAERKTKLVKASSNMQAAEPSGPVATSMEGVASISIVNGKPSSKQIFGTNPNGVRKAQAYYQELMSTTGKATIKAQINGKWMSVSPKTFQKYATEVLGE